MTEHWLPRWPMYQRLATLVAILTNGVNLELCKFLSDFMKLNSKIIRREIYPLSNISDILLPARFEVCYNDFRS
jgi:hypothetical protein